MKPNHILEQNITTALEDNYMPYAMSVIVSRAIPEIDGFKPSHRKLLYTMYKMGLLAGNKTKSANVVGQTMKLNPHGDQAIYETLVRLTRGNAALLHPFIDSKGNMGKQYSRDMAHAAPRYTEVKLDNICQEIFRDIEKNPVDFVDNYDSTLQEPTLLPTTFPNIIVNPNQGIAVGMANTICSFNLQEVCETTIQFIKNEQVDVSLYLKAPDFSSGGQIIYNKQELDQIYKTGRGGFKLRARYRYDSVNNCIEIYEIPYTTNIEVIIDKIIDLVKTNKIKDITDVRDETDLHGLKITLDLKKSTNPDLLMNKLYKLTPLQDAFNCNFNILIDGHPRVLGIATILHEWVRFRITCIKRQLQFDIEKKSQKLHLLIGLEKILLDIDRAISIIRSTEEEQLVIPNLEKGFHIDPLQAEFIAEIKLRNLNKQYILKRTAETNTLKDELKELKSTLESDDLIKKVIIKQLKEISKNYGQSRKTEIIETIHIEEITEEHFIEDYAVKLFLTDHSYFKKIPLLSLRSASEQKLKEDDWMIQEIEINNKADLLLFSNKHVVYKLKVYELNDCKASSLGEYLPNILHLDEDERILYMVATTDYKGYMLFAFENGKMAKIEVSSYETKTNRKKLINAYSDQAPLVFMTYIQEDIDLVVFRGPEQAFVLHTSLIQLKSTRNSQGVQVVTLKKNTALTQVKIPTKTDLEEYAYYRVKKIPSSGRLLRIS